MKNFLLVLILSLGSLFTMAQRNQHPTMLNGEEKAYMYHVVMKSKILRSHLSEYFHYTGEMIYLTDNRVNYDSIEIMIMQEPSLLVIETQELSRQSKGLLSELTTKMALWKLNNALKFGALKNEEYQHLSAIYEEYMALVLQNLPPGATKKKKEETVIPKKIKQLSNPTFSLNDKLAVIGGNSGFSPLEQKSIIESFNKATNLWVKNESKRIFYQIGGQANYYDNILQSAGDGSMTAGLLDEHEKDERGRFGKGAPKAIGLFTYQLEITKDNRNKDVVKPLQVPEEKFKTVVKPGQTNIHFSVWGFNNTKQTTVCIQKGANSYLLYGSEKSRMLSPDSAFGEGETYHRHIDKLENEIIADLKEKIYGKHGFEYLINKNKDELDDVMMSIKKTEVLLNDFRKYGASPGKRIKKKKKKAQNELVALYERKEYLEKEIRELEAAWEVAMEKLSELETELDKMKRNLGYTWLDYKEKDSIYTFTDGAVFNMKTQDFRFPATEFEEEFSIRTISIGSEPLSKSVDEINLHINITDVAYREELLLDLSLEDVFDSDSYQLDQKLFTEEDSTKLYELCRLIQNQEFEFKIEGRGIGKMEYGIIEKDLSPNPQDSYSGDKNAPKYKDLRKTLIWVDDKEVKPQILIRSYCDPVKSNLDVSHKAIQKFMSKHPKTSKNEILTGMRALEVYEKFIDELIQFASNHLERSEANQVIDKLVAAQKKIQVKINDGHLNYSHVKSLL